MIITLFCITTNIRLILNNRIDLPSIIHIGIPKPIFVFVAPIVNNFDLEKTIFKPPPSIS